MHTRSSTNPAIKQIFMLIEVTRAFYSVNCLFILFILLIFVYIYLVISNIKTIDLYIFIVIHLLNSQTGCNSFQSWASCFFLLGYCSFFWTFSISCFPSYCNFSVNVYERFPQRNTCCVSKNNSSHILTFL